MLMIALQTLEAMIIRLSRGYVCPVHSRSGEDSTFIQEAVPMGEAALAPELALVAARGDLASALSDTQTSRENICPTSAATPEFPLAP